MQPDRSTTTTPRPSVTRQRAGRVDMGSPPRGSAFPGLSIILGSILAAAAAASEPALNVQWHDGHQGVAFDFQEQRRTYPEGIDASRFPAPGSALKVAVTAEWPVVTLHARWSMSTEG